MSTTVSSVSVQPVGGPERTEPQNNLQPRRGLKCLRKDCANTTEGRATFCRECWRSLPFVLRRDYQNGCRLRGEAFKAIQEWFESMKGGAS